MKFTISTAVTLLASITTASQTLKISELFINGQKTLDAADAHIYVVSFTLNQDSNNVILCSAHDNHQIPTGKIAGGCRTATSGTAVFDFSLDQVVSKTDVILTLFQPDGASGSVIIPNACQVSGVDAFVCDQSNEVSVIVS